MRITNVNWLVLFCVGSFFLFYGGVDQLNVRSIKELWNLGHIVYFALTVYLLTKIKYLKNVPRPYQWIGFLLFCLLWGTLIEILQYDTARTPDIGDIVRDLTGGLLVLTFHPALLKLSSRANEVFVKLVVATVLFIQLIPLIVALIDEVTAHFQFPVLSSFEMPFELDRWDGGAGKEVVSLNAESDKFQLKIDFTTSKYSGVGMRYFPSDWRGFETLNLRLLNPSDEPLSMVIRIHDARHETGSMAYAYNDRFNSRLSLHQGWNDITIALSTVEASPYQRKMDLSQIRDISLFTTRLSEPRVVYIDSIGLQ